MSWTVSPLLSPAIDPNVKSWELIRKDAGFLNATKELPNMEEMRLKTCERCEKHVAEVHQCRHCKRKFCTECGNEHLQAIFGKLDELQEKLQKKLTEWTQLKVTFQTSCEETLTKIAELEKALMALVGDRTSSLLDDCGLVMRRRLWEYETQIKLMQEIQRNLNTASNGLAYEQISLQDADKVIQQVENLLTEADSWKKEYQMDLNYDPLDVQRVNWSLITTGHLFTRPSKEEELLKEKARRMERARRQLEERNSFKPIKRDEFKLAGEFQDKDPWKGDMYRPPDSTKTDSGPSALNSHNLRPKFDSIRSKMITQYRAPTSQISPAYLDGQLPASGPERLEKFGNFDLEASAFRRTIGNPFHGPGSICAPGTFGNFHGTDGSNVVGTFENEPKTPALNRTLESVRRLGTAVESLGTLSFPVNKDDGGERSGVSPSGYLGNQMLTSKKGYAKDSPGKNQKTSATEIVGPSGDNFAMQNYLSSCQKKPLVLYEPTILALRRDGETPTSTEAGEADEIRIPVGEVTSNGKNREATDSRGNFISGVNLSPRNEHKNRGFKINSAKSAQEANNGPKVRSASQETDSSIRKEKDPKRKRKKAEGFESDYFSGDSLGPEDSKDKVRILPKILDSEACTSQPRIDEGDPRNSLIFKASTRMDSRDLSQNDRRRSEERRDEKLAPAKDPRAQKAQKDQHKTKESSETKQHRFNSLEYWLDNDQPPISKENKSQRNASTSSTGKQKTVNSPRKTDRNADESKSLGKGPQRPDDPGPSRGYPRAPPDPMDASDSAPELKDAQCQITRYRSGKIHFSSKRFRHPTNSTPRTRDAQSQVCSIKDRLVDFTYKKFPSNRGRNLRHQEFREGRNAETQTLENLLAEDTDWYRLFEHYEEMERIQNTGLRNRVRWDTIFRGSSRGFTEESAEIDGTGKEDNSTLFTDSCSPVSTASKETTDSSQSKNGSSSSEGKENQKREKLFGTTTSQDPFPGVQSSVGATSKTGKDGNQIKFSKTPKPIKPPTEQKGSQTSSTGSPENWESGKRRTLKPLATETKDPSSNNELGQTYIKSPGNYPSSSSVPGNDEATTAKQHLKSKTAPNLTDSEDFEPKSGIDLEEVDDSRVERLHITTDTQEVPQVKNQNNKRKESKANESKGTQVTASSRSHQKRKSEKTDTSAESSRKSARSSSVDEERYMSSGPPSIFQVDPPEVTQNLEDEMTEKEPAQTLKSNINQLPNEAFCPKNERNQNPQKDKETKHGTSRSLNQGDPLSRRDPKHELLRKTGNAKQRVHIPAMSSGKDDATFGSEALCETPSTGSGSDHFSYKRSNRVINDSGSDQLDYTADTEFSSTKSDDKKSEEKDSKESEGSPSVKTGSHSDLTKDMFDHIVSGVCEPWETEQEKTDNMTPPKNIDDKLASEIDATKAAPASSNVSPKESNKDFDDQRKDQSEITNSPKPEQLENVSYKLSGTKDTKVSETAGSTSKEPKVTKTPTTPTCCTLDLSEEKDDKEAANPKTRRKGPKAGSADNSPTKSDENGAQPNDSYEKISDSEVKEKFENVFPTDANEKSADQEQTSGETGLESLREQSGTSSEMETERLEPTQALKIQDGQKRSEGQQTHYNQHETPAGDQNVSSETKTSKKETCFLREVKENAQTPPETEGMTESTTSSSQDGQVDQNGQQSNGASSNGSYVDIKVDLSPTQSVDSNGFVKVHEEASDLKQNETRALGSEGIHLNPIEASGKKGAPKTSTVCVTDLGKDPEDLSKLDSHKLQSESQPNVELAENITVVLAGPLKAMTTETATETESESNNQESRHKIETTEADKQSSLNLVSQSESQLSKNDSNQTSHGGNERPTKDVIKESGSTETEVTVTSLSSTVGVQRSDEDTIKKDVFETTGEEKSAKVIKETSPTKIGENDYKKDEQLNCESSNESFVDMNLELSPTQSVDSNEFVKIHDNLSDLKQDETEMLTSEGSSHLKPSVRKDDPESSSVSATTPNTAPKDVIKLEGNQTQPEETKILTYEDDRESAIEKLTGSGSCPDGATEETHKTGSETKKTASDQTLETVGTKYQPRNGLDTDSQPAELESDTGKIAENETMTVDGGQDGSISHKQDESFTKEPDLSEILSPPTSIIPEHGTSSDGNVWADESFAPYPESPQLEPEMESDTGKANSGAQSNEVSEPEREPENFSLPGADQELITPQKCIAPEPKTEPKDATGSRNDAFQPDYQTDKTDTPLSPSGKNPKNISKVDSPPEEESKTSSEAEQRPADSEESSRNLSSKSAEDTTGSAESENNKVNQADQTSAEEDFKSEESNKNTLYLPQFLETELTLDETDQNQISNKDKLDDDSTNEKTAQSDDKERAISKTSLGAKPNEGEDELCKSVEKVESVESEDQPSIETRQSGSTAESDMESSTKSDENGSQSNTSWDKISEFDAKEDFESVSPTENSINLEDRSPRETESKDLATSGGSQVEPKTQTGTDDEKPEGKTPNKTSAGKGPCSDPKMETQPSDSEPSGI